MSDFAIGNSNPFQKLANVVQVPKGKEKLAEELIKKDGADNISFKLEDGTNFVATGLDLKTNPIKEGTEVTFNCKKGVVTGVDNEKVLRDTKKDLKNYEKNELKNEYLNSPIDLLSQAVEGFSTGVAITKLGLLRGAVVGAAIIVTGNTIRDKIADVVADKKIESLLKTDVNLIKNTLEPEKK